MSNCDIPFADYGWAITEAGAKQGGNVAIVAEALLIEERLQARRHPDVKRPPFTIGQRSLATDTGLSLTVVNRTLAWMGEHGYIEMLAPMRYAEPQGSGLPMQVGTMRLTGKLIGRMFRGSHKLRLERPHDAFTPGALGSLGRLVVSAVRSGATSADMIADWLHLNPHTVRSQLRRLTGLAVTAGTSRGLWLYPLAEALRAVAKKLGKERLLRKRTDLFHEQTERFKAARRDWIAAHRRVIPTGTTLSGFTSERAAARPKGVPRPTRRRPSAVVRAGQMRVLAGLRS